MQESGDDLRPQPGQSVADTFYKFMVDQTLQLLRDQLSQLLNS